MNSALDNTYLLMESTSTRAKAKTSAYVNLDPSPEQIRGTRTDTEVGANAKSGDSDAARESGNGGNGGEVGGTEADQMSASILSASASLLTAHDPEETNSIDNSQVTASEGSPSPQRLGLSPRLRGRVATGRAGNLSHVSQTQTQTQAQEQPQQQEQFAAEVSAVTDAVDDSFELIQRYYRQ